MNYSTVRKLLKIWLMKRLKVPATMSDGHRLYGQGLDDGYLLRIFRGRSNGHFVDVGANDGVFISNTFALYRLGWRGICIEPHPGAFEKLRVNRPLDVCVGCAAGNPGDVELVWDGAISEGARIGVPTPDTASAKVASRRLTDILDEAKFPPDFDLLCVDVEGYELNVLRSLDWARYSPRIVMVEHNAGGVATSSAIDFLGTLGYRPVVINRWNCIVSRFWTDDIIAAHRSQAWFTASA